jgi:o-succinylbenzoate synthase
VPLYKALGGVRNKIEAGLAVGIYPSLKDLMKSIEKHLSEGYKRLKIKIQPGWDIDPLKEIRKTFGKLPLMVDANCSYDNTHFDHLKKLDEFELLMIEQPLSKDDLDGHAKLQTMIQTPVCLDEGAKDLPTMQEAIRKKSCKIVNIKIQRVGGLRNAVAMHDLCAATGIPVWAGTMPELGIGSAQTAHLATLSNFAFPTDVESSSRWFVDDIVEPELKVENGMLRIPEGTGNCYRLNGKTVARYKVREEIL